MANSRAANCDRCPRDWALDESGAQSLLFMGPTRQSPTAAAPRRIRDRRGPGRHPVPTARQRSDLETPAGERGHPQHRFDPSPPVESNITRRSGSGSVPTRRSASASTGSDSIHELRCSTSRQAASIAAIARRWLCPTVAQICGEIEHPLPVHRFHERPRRARHDPLHEIASVADQQARTVVHAGGRPRRHRAVGLSRGRRPCP